MSIIKVIITNWSNFFRQMVGLPKCYPVKVLRSPEAKEFDLIDIKKDGDVGYDLPAIEPVVIPAPTEAQRTRFKRYIDIAQQPCNHAMKDAYIACAYDQLPKAVIPTGIRLEMPNTLWCSMEARSSSSQKMLITPDAIIDAGYRGELFAVVFNLGYEDYEVAKGERLVQIIFHERIVAKTYEVDKLGSSERGETGFGSTGDK